jgi:spore maturation protein CgeB
MSSGGMRIIVFGLSLSSSWGNGHATTWRALLRALARRGHDILFMERDTPWYAVHRDLTAPEYCRLVLYDDLCGLRGWWGAVAEADAVIVGSYVPEGVAVGRMVQAEARGVTTFYDIDTPVTLAKLERGDFEYLSPDLIPGYDLYLSFTGGPVLRRLMRDYGAPAAHALYCSVDTEAYRPLGLPARWDLGYLGTWSQDRQPTLERLLIEPARRASHLRFVVAGPQYPADIAWPPNVERIEHVPPAEHPAFYAACRFTLNVTRADMARMGWSPSVRLFEAAACATPIISDIWEGIGSVLAPEQEIILARSAGDVLKALLHMPEEHRRTLGGAARQRILAEHTAEHRAEALEHHLRAAMRSRAAGNQAWAAGGAGS